MQECARLDEGRDLMHKFISLMCLHTAQHTLVIIFIRVSSNSWFLRLIYLNALSVSVNTYYAQHLDMHIFSHIELLLTRFDGCARKRSSGWQTSFVALFDFVAFALFFEHICKFPFYEWEVVRVELLGLCCIYTWPVTHIAKTNIMNRSIETPSTYSILSGVAHLLDDPVCSQGHGFVKEQCVKFTRGPRKGQQLNGHGYLLLKETC